MPRISLLSYTTGKEGQMNNRLTANLIATKRLKYNNWKIWIHYNLFFESLCFLLIELFNELFGDLFRESLHESTPDCIYDSHPYG